jgi:hypothetical protein
MNKNSNPGVIILLPYKVSLSLGAWGVVTILTIQWAQWDWSYAGKEVQLKSLCCRLQFNFKKTECQFNRV